MDEKEAEKIVHLEMRNIKLTELQRLKNRGLRIRREKDRARRRTKGKKSPQTQTITRNSDMPLSKD